MNLCKQIANANFSYGKMSQTDNIRINIHTFGEKSSVRYTAFELSSQHTNGGCNSVCKYRNPRATPSITFMRLSQDNWDPSPSKFEK